MHRSHGHNALICTLISYCCRTCKWGFWNDKKLFPFSGENGAKCFKYFIIQMSNTVGHDGLIYECRRCSTVLVLCARRILKWSGFLFEWELNLIFTCVWQKTWLPFELCYISLNLFYTSVYSFECRARDNISLWQEKLVKFSSRLKTKESHASLTERHPVYVRQIKSCLKLCL